MLLVITERQHKYHDKEMVMKNLKREIADFVEKRDWQEYHTPKNLAMALSVECSELLEIFQWMTPEESQAPDHKTLCHIEEEIGDIMIYLINFSEKFNIDPIEAGLKKMGKNIIKHPAPKAV